ncbi:MAG TPA: PEP-CTERM sorting domain-containing protein, partial [Fimbriimonadaceae bacterium]|nr:PEP-CTERM sorting domain-containing protein [Fimbriimonadaceae bacterium]
ASRNAGSVFVTDQVYDPNQGLFNPYDQLPSYWDQEVAALAPEPGTLLVVGLGSALLLRSRKRSKPPAA